MKLRIIATVLLLVALSGAIVGAWFLRAEYDQVRQGYEIQVQQLQTLDNQAAQLQLTLDGLTMDTAQARQDQADALNQQARELSQELTALRSEIEELRSYLEENREAAELAQEELTYLQGVYDALEKGLAEVENYIAGN